jgi:FAD binding domain
MLFFRARRRQRLRGADRPMTAPARETTPLRPPAPAAALAALGDMFGARFSAGLAIREQHCNTTTWLAAQPPDAVVFPRTTAQVQAIMRICACHGVPVIPFGGTACCGTATFILSEKSVFSLARSMS